LQFFILHEQPTLNQRLRFKLERML